MRRLAPSVAAGLARLPRLAVFALGLLGLPTLALSSASDSAADAQGLDLHARDLGPPGSHTERPPWFVAGSIPDRNPTLVLAPGSTDRIVLANDGTLWHSLHVQFDATDAHTLLLAPNETATLTVQVPQNASGLGLYWCDAHRVAGMVGTVAFRTADAHAVNPAAVYRYAIPAAAAWLAVPLAALLLRRRP